MYSFEVNVCEKEEEEMWKLCTYPTVEKHSYLVSSYGRIQNVVTGRILKLYKLVKPGFPENVYYIIKLKSRDPLTKHKKYKNFRVSRLVAWEFCELKEGCNVVEHINDNKLDNYFRNLKWSTSGENTRNAMKTGRLKIRGEDHANCKYDPLLIHFLCGLIEEGRSNKEVLRIWCGKDATLKTEPRKYAIISHLRAKDRFTDIAQQYDYEVIFRLSDEDKKILEYIESGKENIDIMNIYGYERFNDNTSLYSQIVRCRRIYNIRSTTREKESEQEKCAEGTEQAQ